MCGMAHATHGVPIHRPANSGVEARVWFEELQRGVKPLLGADCVFRLSIPSTWPQYRRSPSSLETHRWIPAVAVRSRLVGCTLTTT